MDILLEQPAADEFIGKWRWPLNRSPTAPYWAESSALTQKLIQTEIISSSIGTFFLCWSSLPSGIFYFFLLWPLYVKWLVAGFCRECNDNYVMVTNQSPCYFFSPPSQVLLFSMCRVNMTLPEMLWCTYSLLVVGTHNKKVLIPWGQGDVLGGLCMFSPCVRGTPRVWMAAHPCNFSPVMSLQHVQSVPATVLKIDKYWRRVMTQGIKDGFICFSPVYLSYILGEVGLWIWLYGWLSVLLHKTGSDKRVEMDLDPAPLSLFDGDGAIRSVLPWLILLIFRELSPRRILDLALQSRCRQREALEFINMVGNKGCLSVEYWLCERSDWRNLMRFARKDVSVRSGPSSRLLDYMNKTQRKMRDLGDPARLTYCAWAWPHACVRACGRPRARSTPALPCSHIDCW